MAKKRGHQTLRVLFTLHLPPAWTSTQQIIMFVIADGGASKADWVLWQNESSTKLVTTTGFNPNYDSSERITAIIREELAPHVPVGEVSEVFYYGAGCWDPGRKTIVESALRPLFFQAKISIHHDLLAAARATCGTAPGIACILGTGSNSVLYDGVKEIDNVTNLGFLLGDEGSGAQIGKELVKAFFYREMPADLHPIMEQACPNGRKDILDKVYWGGIPAAYLASFVQLFSEKKSHPFFRGIAKKCFAEFLDRHVLKYEGHEHLPIHFVGSIAFHLQDILRETLEEKSLHLGTIIKKPIDNLVAFHLNQKAVPAN